MIYGIKDDMIMWRRLYIGSLKGRQSGMNIQCDNVVEERNPDIIVVSKKETKCIIVDIAIPGDSRVHEKEFQKIENYQDLKWEIRRMWSVRNVDVVPVVVGALGSVTKNLGKWIEKFWISICNSGAKRAPITCARGAPLLRNMITHRREKFWFYRHDVNDHPSVRPCVHPSICQCDQDHASLHHTSLILDIHVFIN